MTDTVNGTPQQTVILGPKQFEAIKKIIYDVAGISLAPHKAQMVSNRIAKRIKALGLEDYDDYIDYLRHEKHGEQEMPDLVNVLTTNVTHFFRENHHFNHLKANLTALLKTNAGKRIRIWSAGCSSGQEPYSIALTCLETMHALGVQANLRILATDIDTTILARARDGLYSAEALKTVSQDYLNRHFTQEGETHYRISRNLRELVAFNYFNLNTATWPMKGPFQAIFCRNVLIYFDREKQHSFVEKMARLLEPGGFLYLGHSEHYAGSLPCFAAKGQTVYEYKGT